MSFTAGNVIERADIINVFNSTVVAAIKANAYHRNNPPMDGQYQCVPSNMMDDIANLETPNVGLVGGRISAATLANALITTTQNLTRVGTFSYVRTHHTSHIVRSQQDANRYAYLSVRSNSIATQATLSGKVVFTKDYVRALGSNTTTSLPNASPASYFSVSGSTITGLTATGKAANMIVIPSTINGVTITAINSNALQNSTSLNTLIIPESVTNIGNYAFRNCTALQSVIIHGRSTNIGQYAFQGCTSLTTVTIYGTVASIGNYAFQNCTKLTTANLYCNITNATLTYTFYNCTTLKTVTIPSSVVTLNNAFYACNAITTVYYQGSSTGWSQGVVLSGNNGSIANATKTYNYMLPVAPTNTSAAVNLSHSIAAGNPINISGINALCSACLSAWNATTKYNYAWTNPTCHTDCHNNCHYNCHSSCHGSCYSD